MVKNEFLVLRETELLLKRLGIDTSEMSLEILRKIHSKMDIIEKFDQRMLIVESVLNRLDKGEYTLEETVVILVNYVIDLIQRTKGGELLEILSTLPEYYVQCLYVLMEEEEDLLE